MPRLAPVLTEKQVQSLAKKVGVHSDGAVPGLHLRVRETKTGLSATWCLRNASTGGKVYSLGATYPTVGLKKARELARQSVEVVKEKNLSPLKLQKVKREKAEKAREKEVALSLTFGELIEEWQIWKTESGRVKRPEEWLKKEPRRIAKHLKSLYPVAVVSITPEDVVEALKPIWCEQRETADRLAIHLRDFFKWAMNVRKIRDRGLNPADSEYLKMMLPAKQKRKAKRHHPALSYQDVPRFFEALKKSNTQTSRIIEFAILSCVRSANARGMKWEQLNEDWTLWEIPAEEMKVTSNGQHKVPLTDGIRTLLKVQKELTVWPDSPYVFPSPLSPNKPCSAETLEVFIKRMHLNDLANGGEGFLDQKLTNSEGKEAVATLHGFRATFETWAFSQRLDERAVELILAHEADRSGLRSAYDRDESLPYKMRVLTTWDEYCLGKDYLP